jgi:hypothetical protein
VQIFRSLFFATLFFSSAVFAQTFNMNMETNLAPWTSCVLPDCNPGGLGIPTGVVIEETGSGWPASSLKISETGPSFTNLLVYDKVGTSAASSFNSDFWIYVPTGVQAASYQALEYDIFEFLAPYRFMFGSQCVIKGQWQIWDELHGQWMNTALPCSLTFGAWHHIQWWVHRVNGDLSCDGYPCMHYDMLGIDQNYTQFATTEPAGPIPVGWGNDSGLNFQLDLAAVTGDKTVTEYLKHVNLAAFGD